MVPEVVRSAEKMTNCKESDCDQEVDAVTLICGNGHSNAQGLACSHGRNGPCIDCYNNDVKKCMYRHWMLVSDTRCSTCDSIFRSQLVNRIASNDSGLDSGRAPFLKSKSKTSTLFTEEEISSDLEKVLVAKGWKTRRKKEKVEDEERENGFNEKGEWRKSATFA